MFSEDDLAVDIYDRMDVYLKNGKLINITEGFLCTLMEHE